MRLHNQPRPPLTVLKSPSYGSEWSLKPQVMLQWTSSNPLSQIFAMNSHSHFKNTFNFTKTYTLFDSVILYKDHLLLMVAHSAHQGVALTTAQVEVTDFWPGITPPSSPLIQPTYPPVQPTYMFPWILADFSHYKAVNYLIVPDQYSN